MTTSRISRFSETENWVTMNMYYALCWKQNELVATDANVVEDMKLLNFNSIPNI